MVVWRIRHALRGHWLRRRGLAGEFDQPEDSERSRALTQAWARCWPEALPIGHLMRETYPDRWVRFHTLPQSKRHADSTEEHAEILTRQRDLLAELLGTDAPEKLTAIALDFDANDLASGMSRRHLPAAWPWRRIEHDDPEAPATYLWVRSSLSSDELDTLLIAIADGRAHALLTDRALTSLFCPYDGGVDLILPDPATRDALRDRHPDWLSRHPLGL